MSIFTEVKTIIDDAEAKLSALESSIEMKITDVKASVVAEEVTLINDAIALLQAKLATIDANQVASTSETPGA